MAPAPPPPPSAAPPLTTAKSNTNAFLPTSSSFMILSMFFLNFLTCGMTAKVHGICLRIQRNVRLMMPARAPKSETTFCDPETVISRFAGFPLGDDFEHVCSGHTPRTAMHFKPIPEVFVLVFFLISKIHKTSIFLLFYCHYARNCCLPMILMRFTRGTPRRWAWRRWTNVPNPRGFGLGVLRFGFRVRAKHLGSWLPVMKLPNWTQ